MTNGTKVQKRNGELEALNLFVVLVLWHLLHTLGGEFDDVV